MPKKYRSQIPANAREKVVERYPDGARRVTEYFLGKQLAGRRYWEAPEDGGGVTWDIPFRKGLKHGLELSFYDDGQIQLAEPYLAGLVHGTAKHFAPDGRLLGTYSMKRGTGVDLWRDDVTGRLREEWHCENGYIVLGRGWNGDDRTIFMEWYCRPRVGYHGICREWNNSARFRRGFPQYYVLGKKVTKRQYLRACETDPSLPKYGTTDDDPYRKLPAEYLAQLKRTRKK